MGLLYDVAKTQSVDTTLAKLGEKLQLTVLGDNDFYSQEETLKARNLPYTADSLRALPPHQPCVGGAAALRKTGLGSSAALVTSVVGALSALLHFEGDCVHNVAQLAHCAAQGKV